MFLFFPLRKEKYYLSFFLIAFILIFLLSCHIQFAYASAEENKITSDDLERIKSELNFSDEYPFVTYSDWELLKALNQEVENVTLGQIILTALDEQHLIDHCYPTFNPTEASTYFSNMLNRFSDKRTLFGSNIVSVLVDGAVSYLGSQKVSLGVSTIFLLSDLAEINISLKKLSQLCKNRALYFYLIQRCLGDSHAVAWDGCGIPPVYQNEATENYFLNLWKCYGPAIQKQDLQTFFQKEHEELKELIKTALEELIPEKPQGPTLVLSAPLTIITDPPYYQGDEIKAKFSLLNQGKQPVTLSVLTLGGRDPDEYVSDFTHQQNVIIEASKSYDYQGTLQLNKAGEYHFFCTYQTQDGEWNTNVDVDSKITDEDREEDIYVEEAIEEKIEEGSFKTFYYEDDCIEYSVKYPDWSVISDNISSTNFDNIKKLVTVENSSDISISIIISQDVNYMPDKLIREMIQEASVEEAIDETGKTIAELVGKTQVLKEDNNIDSDYLEALLDLDSYVFKQLKKIGISKIWDCELLHFLCKNIFTEENNKYFSILILVSENKWEEYKDIVHQIINTMKYKKIKGKNAKARISDKINYFPLDKGKRWEYQIYVNTKEGIYLGLESKISGKQVCTILPQRELKGKRVTPMQIEENYGGPFYTRFLFYSKDQKGVYEFAHQQPKDIEPKISHDYIIKYPTKVGNSWQEMEGSQLESRISVPINSTIESIDDVVTVPAGTFKNCLKIKSVGLGEETFVGEDPDQLFPKDFLKEKIKVEVEYYNWFAPNVGLIKAIYKEKKTSSGALDITLSDFVELIMQLETFK